MLHIYLYTRTALFWDITRRRVVITTRHRVISQKSTDLINIAAEAWNQGYYLYISIHI
jgi:hypothetical protein